MGRSLLIFWDAVDALSFDAQLLIEPHFTLGHVAKRCPGMLNMSGADNLDLWCHREPSGLGALLPVSRDNNRMLAGLNILLKASVRHVCFDSIGTGSLVRRQSF